MKKSFLINWLLVLTLVAGVSFSILRTEAQTSLPDEILVVPVGSLFEIIGDTNVENASYYWVFTKGEEFLQATIDPFFRIRLVQPGFYELSVEITDQKGTILSQRRIGIDVQTPERYLKYSADSPQEPSPVATTIVETDPPLNGRTFIVMDRKKQILRIEPINTQIDTISIDLDTAKDTDKDGDPKNDTDNANTFSITDGTPVYVLFQKAIQKREIRVTSVLKDEEEVMQDIQLISPQYSLEEEKIDDQQIKVEQLEAGTVSFKADLSTEGISSRPLLYIWKFGDGSQSMLDRPIHTYKRDGTFSVSVILNDLQTGKILREFHTRISVQLEESASSSSDSSSEHSSVSSIEEGEGDGGSSSLWILIAKIIGALVVAAGLGVGGMFLFSKLKNRKGGSLDALIEKAEEKFIEKKSPTDIIDTSMTMSLGENEDEELPSEPKAEILTAEIVEPESVQEPVKVEPTPSPSSPVEPPKQESKVPSWLQQSEPRTTSEPAEKAPAQESAAPTTEVPTSPPPPSREEVTFSEPAPLQPPPVQDPAYAPLPPPPTDENAPAWLKNGLEEAKEKGQTPDSPPPESLQVPPPLPMEEKVDAKEIPSTNEPEVMESVGDEMFESEQRSEPDQSETSIPEAPLAASEGPAPAWLQPQNIQQEPKDDMNTTVSNSSSADEAERERKRRKRQRYRENLKKRKQEESSDDSTAPEAKPVEQPILPADDKPIAIIRAVGLEEKPIKPLENLPTDQGKD